MSELNARPLYGLRLTGLFLGTLAGICAANGFQRSTPPLLEDATAAATGAAYDCEEDINPAGNPEFAQSPEIDSRLRTLFPLGTPSERLRRSLVQQGFRLRGHCSEDRTISWAQFEGPAREFVRIYWRKSKQGRLLWEFGELDRLP